MFAMEEIHELLLKAGLNDEEADLLLSRMLFEESLDFVKAMYELNESRIGGLKSLFSTEDHLLH